MYRRDMQFPKVGPSVFVRPLERSDLVDLYNLESDSDVKQFMGGPVPNSPDEWMAGMQETLPICGVLTVVAKGDGRFAGMAKVSNYLRNPLSRDRELVIVIAKSFWGRGFGMEVSDLLIPAAFSELHAERVIVVVHPHNVASLKLAERLGFLPVDIVTDPGSWQHGHHVLALSRAAAHKCGTPLRSTTKRKEPSNGKH